MRKLTSFTGTLKQWCEYVNENKITGEQIFQCQFITLQSEVVYLDNAVKVVATIWRDAE